MKILLKRFLNKLFKRKPSLAKGVLAGGNYLKYSIDYTLHVRTKRKK